MLNFAHSPGSVGGKVLKPSERKLMAIKAMKQFKLSIRLACTIFCISKTCLRYQAVHSEENDEIARALIRLTACFK